MSDAERLKYPDEAICLRKGDVLIYKPRKVEHRILADKWWINRNTPVGDDAELYQRKPYGGNKMLDFKYLIAVERICEQPTLSSNKETE